MRALSTILTVSFLVACGADEPEPALDTTPPAEESVPDAAPTLADFAGTWNQMVTLEGVADPVPSQIEATATGTGWLLRLEGRDPIALSVSMHGDSVIMESEPYESILRPGVTTVVREAVVLEGGMWLGNVTVTYRTETGDEVVRGTVQGTR